MRVFESSDCDAHSGTINVDPTSRSWCKKGSEIENKGKRNILYNGEQHTHLTCTPEVAWVFWEALADLPVRIF